MCRLPEAPRCGGGLPLGVRGFVRPRGESAQQPKKEGLRRSGASEERDKLDYDSIGSLFKTSLGGKMWYAPSF